MEHEEVQQKLSKIYQKIWKSIDKPFDTVFDKLKRWLSGKACGLVFKKILQKLAKWLPKTSVVYQEKLNS